ncbi:unnamed protein product [Effrenium voratum]|nr:unnamed protein product [Effrenium voratum]
MKRKAQDPPDMPSKQDAMSAANKKLLLQLFQRGDFLGARRRSQVVREAFQATANCPGCARLHAEGRRKKPEDAFKAIAAAEHHFFEEEQCGELGPLVHGLANLQHLLNSQWYFTAADALWKVLGAKGELPNLKLPEGSKELKDEKAVRLCELIDVVGAAVGIRAYHRASGLSMPTLSPVPAEDKAPLFQRVTDFCSSGIWPKVVRRSVWAEGHVQKDLGRPSLLLHKKPPAGSGPYICGPTVKRFQQRF